MKLSLIGSVAIMTLALAACSSNRQARELAYVERPVEALYNAAADEMDDSDYISAIELFNEVERARVFKDLRGWLGSRGM